MQKLLLTLFLAIKEARANFMHTMLSVLGIVIGVAALVIILSMIDGMEEYANNQISRTTSLESLIITTQTTETIDGVSLKKQDYSFIDYAAFLDLQRKIDSKAMYILYQESGWVTNADTTLKQGVLMRGIVEAIDEKTDLVAGRFFTKNDIDSAVNKAVINKILASKLMDEGEETGIIGEELYYGDKQIKVIGVIDRKGKEPQIFLPITCFTSEEIRARPPQCIIIAETVEHVPATKQKIENWLQEYFDGPTTDFVVSTNEQRVKQTTKAFLIFRIIMGLIVGVSVIVGGIGVMNVLLITVSERTAEIGIRKAVGASRKDIVTQFLTESIIISSFGSIIGLLLGVLFTLTAVPVIRHITDIPFHAAYTINTIIVIGIVALLVGIIFGTYPALKAAKLNPVDAIRRE